MPICGIMRLHLIIIDSVIISIICIVIILDIFDGVYLLKIFWSFKLGKNEYI